MAWLVEMDETVHEWLNSLDNHTYLSVMAALVVLREDGPRLGRPLVDSITGSVMSNLKELRPPAPGRQTIRILFAFDPVRSAFLLVAGDKAGDWVKWYKRNIPLAEQRWEKHLRELRDRKESQ